MMINLIQKFKTWRRNKRLTVLVATMFGPETARKCHLETVKFKNLSQEQKDFLDRSLL